MELFFTLSLALLLSFLVAKLISLAMPSNCFSEFKSFSLSHQTVLQDGLSVRGEECVDDDAAAAAASEKISTLSCDINLIEMNLERGNEEEIVCQLLENLEKSCLGGEFNRIELVGRVSESESVDDLKKLDDEKIDVELTNDDDDVDFSQIVEVMEMEKSVLKNEDIVVESLSDDDDDDWEGIERSEIENVFLAASKFVGSGEIGDRLANMGRDFQMELYGLRKVANEGPCREPQPVSIKVSARAKWNAWQRLGNISPDEAMERYISLLSDTLPGWMNSAGQSTSQPLEAEALGAPASNIMTSLTRPNSSIGSKPELNLGDERNAHVGGLDMKNKVEG